MSQGVNSFEKRSVIEEIKLLRNQVEDLKKRLDILEPYIYWGGSYIKELLKVVGIQ